MQQRGTICFFAIVLSIIIFAIGSALVNKDNFCGYACYRRKQPAPYQNASYFSESFMDASLSFPQPIFSENKAPFYPPFSSQWLNVVNGVRKTKYQPSRFNRKIYIVGGSTVVGQEVPDEWTISSRLQFRLGSKAKVENYGYSGITSREQLKVVESLPLKPKDIVIVLDGVNDALSFFLKVENSEFDKDSSIESSFIGTLTFFPKWTLFHLNRFRHFLLSFTFFSSIIGDEPTFIFQNFVPSYLKSADQVDQLTKKLKIEMKNNIFVAKKIVEDRGASYVHVFQPILVPGIGRTKHEELLIDNASLYPEVIKIILKKSYVIYSEIEKEGISKYIPQYKLATALEKHGGGYESFLDFCHLNHDGNEIIAKEILHYLDQGKYIK